MLKLHALCFRLQNMKSLFVATKFTETYNLAISEMTQSNSDFTYIMMMEILFNTYIGREGFNLVVTVINTQQWYNFVSKNLQEYP